MPPRKTTPRKRRVAEPLAKSEFDELMQPEKEVKVEPRRKSTSREWLNDSLHWSTIGGIAALGLAAIIFGALVVNPRCAAFMGMFLRPWSNIDSVLVVAPPRQEDVVSAKFIVALEARADNEVASRVVETDADASASFASSGTAAAENAYARGTVAILNPERRPFTFVAKTRLLSSEGVLFRLVSQTKLPPNTEDEVIFDSHSTTLAEVIADQPGISGNIGPTTFTFPGLSEALQHQVIAVSSSAMTGGDGVVKVVSETDISRAKAQLLAQITKEATDNFRAMVGGGERLLAGLMTSKETSFIAPKAGTIAEKFDVTLASRFRALIFAEADVEEMLLEKYIETHPGVDKNSLTVRNTVYVVEAYDIAKDRAEVRVEGEVIP